MVNWSIFWKWLSDNASIVSLLFGLLPLIWSVVSYIHSKKQELKQVRFEAYHKLIKQLVERDNPGLDLYLDRQIAVVFELTNFKEYYPVTHRILIGLRKKWLESSSSARYPVNRLIEEIDLTLKHISKA